MKLIGSLSPQASVDDMLRAAANLWRLTLPKCLSLALVAALFGEIANIYWQATGRELGPKMLEDPTYASLSLCGSIGDLYMFLVILSRQRAWALEAAPDTRADFALAWRRYLPVLLVAMLMGALVYVADRLLLSLSGAALVVALLLLIAPVAFVIICYFVTGTVILFEPLSPLQAVARAVRIVRPIWLKVCAATVIGVLVVSVCLLAAGIVLGILQVMVPGDGAAFRALASAIILGLLAVVMVFFTAFWLVVYSAASNSA